MSELMKQLQQWANEGAYLFHEDEKKGGFKGEPSDWSNLQELVLNGTIPVWRPIEHYKPPKGSDILAIVDGMVLQGSIDDKGLFDDDARYCGVPFTHWQPVPQLI